LPQLGYTPSSEILDLGLAFSKESNLVASIATFVPSIMPKSLA